MRDLEASVWEQRHAQGVDGMVKTASDLERYRHVLQEVKPAVVVECGTFNGRSACWFADEARCRVITIDTHPQVDPDVAVHPSVLWLTGNSTDPLVVERVRQLVGDVGPVMVVLDSDHSGAHVMLEMVAYGPMVTKGSYMVVEDGIVRWLPEQLEVYGSSPLDGIELFLDEFGADWDVDDELEDLLSTTQHPGGWLRRIR